MNYLNSSLLGDTKSSVEWGNSHCQTNVDQWRGSGEGLEASSFGEGSLGTIGLRGSELLCPPSRNSKWEDVPFRLPSLSGSWKETDAYSTRIWGKFIEGIIYRGRKCVCVCSITQSCPTLCDPMTCSPPGSSIPGISQARILERVAISFSKESFLTQGSNSHLLH